jgi:protein-tyrosine kinase
MTRISDALRRARSDSSAGSGDPSHLDDTIQFFAPGQPAVVSPWDIADEPIAEFASDEDYGAAPLRPAESASYSSRPGARTYAGFPTGELAEKLVISPSLAPDVAAQYRKLAAALHDAQRERDLKVLMFVSAGCGEGKTLTAANVALTLSESFEKRVLLVDTDLRRPMVHQLLGVSNTRGLGDLLDRERTPAFVQLSSHLSLLPAGEYRDDPAKVFTSDRILTLIEAARGQFDWILLDTPPLDVVPDARLLAPLTDGALLVAMAGKTLWDEVQRAAETFDPKRLLGVVLNGVSEETSLVTSGYYAGHYQLDQADIPLSDQP